MQIRWLQGVADMINGRMLSKNLNLLQRYQHLLDTLPFDCVFDGEICCLDQHGRPRFSALLFGRGQTVYVVFDLLFYEGQDIRGLPLKERRNILDQVAKRYSLQKSELSIGCGKKLYETVCEMDLEGVICKRLDDPYDAENTTWYKVLNRNYTQKDGRYELFERR
jgi:ATP-dependent DNA ligase